MAFPVNTNSNIRASIKMTPAQNTRIHYLKSIQAHTPKTCPFCAHTLTNDNQQIYCPQCGLVCQDSTQYVAGEKICLPYGLKI